MRYEHAHVRAAKLALRRMEVYAQSYPDGHAIKKKAFEEAEIKYEAAQKTLEEEALRYEKKR